jgi:hypothetical protein
MVFMVTTIWTIFICEFDEINDLFSSRREFAGRLRDLFGRASRLVGNSVQMVRPMGHLGVYMPQWFTVATSES